MNPILKESLKKSPFLWWKLYLPENRVEFNPENVRRLGYQPGQFVNAPYSRFTELIHTVDMENVMAAMAALLDGRVEVFDALYRIRMANGGFKWYLSRARLFNLGEGRIVVRGLDLDLGNHFICCTAADELIKHHRLAMPQGVPPERLSFFCLHCYRFRLPGKNWEMPDHHSDYPKPAELVHALCQDCLNVLYPEAAEEVLGQLALKNMRRYYF